MRVRFVITSSAQAQALGGVEAASSLPLLVALPPSWARRNDHQSLRKGGLIERLLRFYDSSP
jgi:hypothetical protein